MSRLIALIALSLASLAASARIDVYPPGAEVQTIHDYTVHVRQLTSPDWLPVATYPVAVDRIDSLRHSPVITSMAYFDFDTPVEVRVINNHAHPSTARIRPHSAGIDHQLVADTLLFTLSEPQNLSIEFDGDIYRNLHLFANPVDTNRPTPKQIKKGRNLIYFPPGLHRLPADTLAVPSNTTVYIDGGARVLGTIIVDRASNVNIFGRGEVHPACRGEGVYIKHSQNVNVDGIIVTQIPVGRSANVNINNVKAISAYGWGDGMNIFASSNVSYNRVFCRNSDDCHTVYATRKGFNGGASNISMANSTLWADVAHPIFIGLHGAPTELGLEATPDTIENLTYTNIDILHHNEPQIDYQGCLAIVCGDNNTVRNVNFNNIRIDNIHNGQLFNIRVAHNAKYCTAPGALIDNITFCNVTYTGTPPHHSVIEGYDPTRPVTNITFDNLVINGLHISDTMPSKPAWYKTADIAGIYLGPHTRNITFR